MTSSRRPRLEGAERQVRLVDPSLRFSAGALPALALVLLPKCPACLAAYGAVFASTGLATRLVRTEFAVALTGVGLVTLFWLFGRQGRWGALLVASCGLGAVLAGTRLGAGEAWSWAGAAALVGVYVVELKRAWNAAAQRASSDECACPSGSSGLGAQDARGGMEAGNA